MDQLWQRVKQAAAQIIENPLKTTITLVVLLLFSASFSQAQLFQRAVTDAVLILVSADLLESDDELPGLATDFPQLEAETLNNRIERYAQSIQAQLPRTETAIISIPEAATVTDVHRLLKRLALTEHSDLTGKPVGVVLIGDIPLPQVNRANREFTSIYPYTDFINPRYSWNSEKEQFAFSQATNQPELWHGVIQFASPSEYAQYFDKNYLAKTGEPGLQVPQRLFFADLVDEQISFNQDLAPAYANYISIAQQRAYQQYTSSLTTILAGRFNQGLSTLIRESDTSLRQLQAELLNAAQTPSPDLFSKFEIDQYSQPFINLLSGYYSRIIPAVEQSGRYRNDSGGITTVGQQISYIDERQVHFFKATNTALNAKINAIVNEHAQPATIAPAFALNGSAVLSNGDRVSINQQVFLNHRSRANVPLSAIINFAKREGGTAVVRFFNVGLNDIITNIADGVIIDFPSSQSFLNAVDLGTQELDRYLREATLYINTQPASDIQTAEQCRIHRGSVSGQQVKTTRVVTNPDNSQQCFLPTSTGETDQFIPDRTSCTDWDGLHLRDEGRLTLVADPQNSRSTFESCYAFRTLPTYFATEFEERQPADIDNPNSLILFTANGNQVSLGEVVQALNPEATTNNHNAWSAALANLPDGGLTIAGADINRSDIQSITLQSRPIGPSKTVSSVITHNDPTPAIETRLRQNGFNSHIPLDKDQFVSYVDSNGQAAYLYYPNLFNSRTYSDYEQKILEAAGQLEQLSGQNHAAELLSVITTEATIWNEEFSEINAVNETVLENMINWYWSDLNSKYQQTLQTSLQGVSTWGEIGTQPGFEIGVLNLPFADNTLDFTLPEIVPQPELADLEVNFDAGQPSPTADQDPTPANSLSSIAGLDPTAACARFYTANGNGVSLLDYAEYLNCWYENEVQSSINQVVSFPAQFDSLLPDGTTNVPPLDQNLASIKLTTTQSQYLTTTTAIPITITLQNQAGDALLGNLQDITITADGPGRLDTNVIQTATGLATIELMPTGSGTIRLTASALDQTTELSLTIIEPFQLELNSDFARAGQVSQATIIISNTSNNAQVPNSLTIASSDLPVLTGEWLINDSNLVNLNFIAPERAGDYPLTITLGEQIYQETLTVNPGQLAEITPVSPTISRFNNDFTLRLVDQFSNPIASQAELRLQSNNPELTLTQQRFETSNGEIVVPFTATQSGNYQVVASINSEQFTIPLRITDQLTAGQLTNLQPAIQHIQLRHNQPEQPRALINNWLLEGLTQTIATSTSTSGNLGGEQQPFTDLTSPLWGLDQATPQLYRLAGNTAVGAAYQSELDETLIVYGDPTFTLAPNTTQNSANYTADIGRELTTVPDTITHVTSTDNSIAIGTDQGEIYLYAEDGLQLLTTVPLGVRQLAWWNPLGDRDAQVLLVVTEERCSERVGCLFAIYYDDDQLHQTAINLDYTDKIKKLIVADLSQDEIPDLLIHDSTDNLKLYLASDDLENAPLNTWVEPTGTLITNLAAEVSPTNNLNEYFLWRQNGYTPTPAETSSGSVRELNGQQYRQLALVPELASSSVTIRDQNGGGLQQGDILTYRIQLKNDGETDLTGSMALPIVNEYAALPETLNCQNCTIEELNTDQFSYQLNNVNIPANQLVTITLDAQLTEQLDQIAHISIVVDAGDYPADGEADIRIVRPGNGQVEYFFSDQTPSGSIVYRSADANLPATTASGQAADLFRQQRDLETANRNNDLAAIQDSAASQFAQTFNQDADGDGVLDAYQGLTNQATRAADTVQDLANNLFCSGGCIATPVNHAFLVPPSSAVPVFGITSSPPYVVPGGTTGTGFRFYLSPTLTAETGVALCAGPFPAGQCRTFRVGLLSAFGDVCQDINHGVVSVMDSAVNAVQNTVEDSTGTIGNDDFGIVVGGTAKVGRGGTTSADRSHFGVSSSVNIKVPGFPEVLTNWYEAQRQEVTNLFDLPDITIITPDFGTYFQAPKAEEEEPEENPEESAEEAEEEERSFAEAAVASAEGYADFIESAQAELDSLNNLYADIAAYSMFDIKKQNYKIKYPYLEPREIQRFTAELIKWWDTLNKEVDRTLASWGCYTQFREIGPFTPLVDPETQEPIELDALTTSEKLEYYLSWAADGYTSNPDNPCYQLLFSYGALTTEIQANIDILADYLELPGLVLTIENFEAKYASALIGIVEQINEHIVQYVKQNTQRIRAWQAMFEDLQTVFGDFKALVDISLEYLKQCDDCRSHRYSDYALLLDFFLEVPDLPVIALPKLPDITIDFSDIRAGTTLIVPEFEFVPEQVKLPTLRPINLPTAPPLNFGLRLPEFGLTLGAKLPEPPDFSDLELAFELPDFLELELPELPLIPLPPDIGGFSANFRAELRGSLELVSQLFRIICIVEKGLVPIPELFLEQKIEQLTARPLNPPLPIDIKGGIGFNLPFPDSFGRYLSKVTVRTHILIDLQFDPLTSLLDAVLEPINDFSTDFAQIWNDGVLSINDFADLNQYLQKYQNPDGSYKGIQSIDFDFSPEEQKVFRDLNLDLSSQLPFEFTQPKPQLFAQLGPAANPEVNTQQQITPVVQPGIYTNEPGSDRAVLLTDFVPKDPSATQISFTDADGDADTDIVYSIDNTLYLKENQSNASEPFFSSSSPIKLEYNELQTTADFTDFAPPKSTANPNTISITLPRLSPDQVLVVEVAPQKREPGPANQQYVVTSDNTTPAAKDTTTVSDQLGWLPITNNDRSLEFGTVAVTRASSTETSWQTQAEQTSVNIPRPDGAYTIRWAVSFADKLSYSPYLESVSQLDCSDGTAPQIPEELANIEVIIYEPPVIDLAESYDLDSEVVSYYIDTNANVDTDGDGDPTNDLLLHGDNDPEIDRDLDGNPANDASISRFQLQASDQPGERQIIAHIFDQAGNQTSLPITITISLPEIVISNAQNGDINGYIIPAVANIPLSVVRNRDGQVQVIPDEAGVVKTDNEGRFQINNGFSSQNVAHILDVSQQQIATIGLESGTILTTSATKVRLRTENEGGTAYIITDANDQVITQVTALSTGLSDVVNFDNQDRNTYQGILVNDPRNSDDWTWELLPGDDPGFPGGAALNNNGERALIVTPAGRISTTTNSINLSLETVRQADDPQWLEVSAGGRVIAQIHVGIQSLDINDPSDLQVIRRRPATGSQTDTSPENLPFVDIQSTDPDFNLIRNLYTRNVLNGKVRDGELYADLENQMSRAEFTSVLLRMLCIVPDEDAQRLPSLFADINQRPDGTFPWYYADIKEAGKRGFVTGYQGQIDPTTGLPIFIPENSISRAEVAKVVLEVLEAQGVISLADIEPTEIWYQAYLNVAVDLNPHFVGNNQPANQFILAPQEAAQPNAPVTRREFFQIVQRVLTFTNCLDQDADGDGLPFHFENEHGLNQNGDDSNLDPDADGLTNIREFELGTNPFDPDTDDGGVGDGVEVNRGTDPLNPRDDQPTADSNAGVGITDIICRTCPCAYTLAYGTTLLPEDSVQAIIRDRQGNVVQSSDRYRIRN